MGKSYWNKVKDVVFLELYTEFVPSFLRKSFEPEFASHELIVEIAWLIASLKLGLVGAFCAILLIYDFGDYEPMIAGLGIYIGVDALYQVLNLRHANSGEFKRGATLAVDLAAYPFCILSQKRRNQSPAKKTHSSGTNPKIQNNIGNSPP